MLLLPTWNYASEHPDAEMTGWNCAGCWKPRRCSAGRQNAVMKIEKLMRNVWRSLASKGAKAQAARNSKAHQTVRCMRQESSRPYSDHAVPNQSEANTPGVQCNVNGSVHFSISHCWLWPFGSPFTCVLDSLAKAWRHWHDKMMMSAASQAQQKSFSSCGREFQIRKIFSIHCHRLGWYMRHGWYKVRLLRGVPVDTKDDWRLSLKLPKGVILAKCMPCSPQM